VGQKRLILVARTSALKEIDGLMINIKDVTHRESVTPHR
jgi:hypothetical protein